MKPEDCLSPASLPPVSSAKVIPFSDLRLREPMKSQVKVLIEYEDRPGGRSFHEVSLTCTARGADGYIYFGGLRAGKFTVFRADCIHRVVAL